MSTPEPQPPSVPIGAIIVLVLAALFYIGMVACLGDLSSPGQDAAGRGLSAAFAVIFGFFVWLWLGILLVIGGVKGSMPFWGGIAAAILLPVSAVTALIALDLQGQATWLLGVPIALPPLFAAYGLWARLTGLHGVLPETGTSLVLLAAIVAVTIAPMPRFIAREIEHARLIRAERVEAEAEAAEAQRRRTATLARFQKLTPNSPLWEWAAFIGKDSELDAQAVAGARVLSHRQTDAEEALRRGMGFPLTEYYRLDLSATPAFCAAADDFLRQGAAAHRAPADQPDDRSVEDYFDPYLGAIEWLTQQKCDLDDAVKAIENAVDASPRPSVEDGFLAMLAWRRGNGFNRREDYRRAIESYDKAIRYRPDNAQYRASRGDAHLDNLDYAGSIPDYTEALRLNPGYSAVYNARGYAYRELGDGGHAFQDFDKAIELDGSFARALYNRGRIYSDRGDQAHAVEDFDAALRLYPKFTDALTDRGRARFHQGAYPQAVSDLAAALAASPTDAYTVLWLYLARARADQPARDGLPQDAAKLDRTAWPWPVIAALLGEAEQGAVLAAARGDKDHACEAEFYFGMKATLDGDASAARNLLQQAVSDCPSTFVEAAAAKFELARLP